MGFGDLVSDTRMRGKYRPNRRKVMKNTWCLKQSFGWNFLPIST